MRQPHYTITPAVVLSTAREALQETLPWQDYGCLVRVQKLLDLLLGDDRVAGRPPRS